MERQFNEKVKIMRIINTIALVLLIVGGLNWGLMALFDLDIVAALFGVDTVLTNIVYGLVGLAAVYSIFLLKPVSHIDHAHGNLAHR
jgi:uncharacterized membrane protein YuzA (DUF378 family)